MNESKKIIKLVIICSLPSFFLFFIVLSPIAYHIFFGGDTDNSIDGYYKYESYSYSISLSNNIYYTKYYYRDTYNEKYLEGYDKVNEENIEMIKDFYNNFKNIMIEQEKSDIFDLDEIAIDYDDYYIIHEYCDPEGEKYSCYRSHDLWLHLYDAQSHILYDLQIYKRFRR